MAAPGKRTAPTSIAVALISVGIAVAVVAAVKASDSGSRSSATTTDNPTSTTPSATTSPLAAGASSTEPCGRTVDPPEVYEHVVMLLDPADPQQAAWLQEARKQFDQHGIAWSQRRLRGGDLAEAERIAASLSVLPRPLAVVVAGEVPVRAAPYGGASAAATLRAGAALLAGRRYGPWLEVRRPDGVHGWVLAADVVAL